MRKKGEARWQPKSKGKHKKKIQENSMYLTDAKKEVMNH